MTAKHTPGPWRHQPGRDSGPPYVIRGSEGGFVVVGMTADRQEADAALIAAAPDLLAGAEAAWNCIAELPSTPARVEAAQLLINAIAKAKGEQQ